MDTIALARISEYLSVVKQAERQPALADDKRELTDLAEPGRHDKRRARRIGKREADDRPEYRFADNDERREGCHLTPVREQVAGIHQHAHRHEEEHRERLAEREEVGVDLMAEWRLADDHAGDERAERERHAEQRRRGERDAQRRGQRHEHEQLARPAGGHCLEHGGDDAVPDKQHQGNEEQRTPHAQCRHEPIARSFWRRQCRQQHENGDRGEILEDQPADGDAPVQGVECADVHQSAKQHDGAGHRDRDSQYQRRSRRPPPSVSQKVPEGGRRRHLHEGAGNRDVTDLPQIAEREVEPDAEHQEDYTEFGQLLNGADVAGNPRREGTERDASEEVADDRGQAKPTSHNSPDERVAKGQRDVYEERQVVHGAHAVVVDRVTG